MHFPVTFIICKKIRLYQNLEKNPSVYTAGTNRTDRHTIIKIPFYRLDGALSRSFYFHLHKWISTGTVVYFSRWIICKSFFGFSFEILSIYFFRNGRWSRWKMFTFRHGLSFLFLTMCWTVWTNPCFFFLLLGDSFATRSSFSCTR